MRFDPCNQHPPIKIYWGCYGSILWKNRNKQLFGQPSRTFSSLQKILLCPIPVNSYSLQIFTVLISVTLGQFSLFLNFIQMESYRMYSLVSGFFHLTSVRVILVAFSSSSFFFLIFIYCGCAGSQLQHVGSQLQHVGSQLQHADSQLLHACVLQFPKQGSIPGPLHWEHGVLPTRQPGKSLAVVLFCCRIVIPLCEYATIYLFF